MAIFLTDTSKVIVQGMTGSEGMKHTQRMLDSGTDIVDLATAFAVLRDSAGCYFQDETGPSGIAHNQVAAAAEDEQRQGSFFGERDSLAYFQLGSGLEEIARGSANAERCEWRQFHVLL